MGDPRGWGWAAGGLLVQRPQEGQGEGGGHVLEPRVNDGRDHAIHCKEQMKIF